MASVKDLLEVSSACKAQAYRFSGEIHDEVSLQQYYTLIEASLQSLIDVKEQYSLSIEQDVYVTSELVRLLLDETRNYDVAEMYLSSLRQRLQNYKNDIDRSYMRYWLRIEFIALYTVSMKRDTKFQYRVALNNCTELVAYLQSLQALKNMDQYDVIEWCQVFQYVEVCHCIKLNRIKRADIIYGELLNSSQKNNKWHAFVLLSYINLSLEQRQVISEETINELDNFVVNDIGIELYVIKLLTQLIIKIYKDENISDVLNQFKEFFDSNKQELNEKAKIVISFNENIRIDFEHPTLFQYKDLKNLLLFLQSVSYLVNCYDETANFSVKFLPKLKKNIKKILNSDINLNDSINHKDDKFQWYNNLFDMTDFYQIWEKLILRSEISEIDSYKKYHDMLEAMKSHTDENETMCIEQANNYYEISQRSKSVEVSMLCLLNCYILLVSAVSRCKDSSKQVLMVRAETIWNDIEELQNVSNISKDNNMWDCSITIVWIISHFEPFTWSPLPCKDSTRSKHIVKLQKYYENNKLLETGTKNIDDNNNNNYNYKMKKSLFLQVMINYLGGRLIETELDKIYEISNKCFQILKGQKNLLNTRYIIGLWHLMNCTISMKSKEVIITKAKLESILQDLEI